VTTPAIPACLRGFIGANVRFVERAEQLSTIEVPGGVVHVAPALIASCCAAWDSGPADAYDYGSDWVEDYDLRYGSDELTVRVSYCRRTCDAELVSIGKLTGDEVRAVCAWFAGCGDSKIDDGEEGVP
jgi:hypothetical protein